MQILGSFEAIDPQIAITIGDYEIGNPRSGIELEKGKKAKSVPIRRGRRGRIGGGVNFGDWGRDR